MSYYENNYDAQQQNRKNKAIFEHMIVRQLDRTKKTAIIESADGENFYSVTLTSCTCPDFIKRGEPCKHMYKLRNTLMEPAVENITATTSNSIQSPSVGQKEDKPKVVAVLLDRPDASFIVIGVIILIVAFFTSGSSIPVGIIVALIGVYLIYCYFAFKRHPEDPRYITEEQLSRWAQLVSSDKKSVASLQKASLPVLLELKKRTENYYNQLCFSTSSSDIQKCSDLLIDTQNKIVELSEFVILKGDDPKKDLKKYTSLVEELE